MERQHSGATGKGMDKDRKRQRKLEDSDGWLLPAVEGHSHEQNEMSRKEKNKHDSVFI